MDKEQTDQLLSLIITGKQHERMNAILKKIEDQRLAGEDHDELFLPPAYFKQKLEIKKLKLEIDELKNKNWIERNPIKAMIITAILTPLFLKLVEWFVNLPKIQHYIEKLIK